MTNEEKAMEIAADCVFNGKILTYNESAKNGALQMARWKDTQHEQEKQQWIEKACEWWTNNWRKYVMTDKDGIVALNFWKGDFKKAMEEV